jgi:hypothetical protein
MEAEKGGPQVLPIRAARHYIAMEVITQAGLSDPRVTADYIQMTTGRAPMDPELDEELERFPRTHHLTEPVQTLFDAFRAPHDDV